MRTATLTAPEMATALALRNERPPVIPGTNAIADDTARDLWYAKVTQAMQVHDISGAAVDPFCNIAGVAD